MKLVKCALLSIAISLVSTSSYAEQLQGADVVTLLSKGRLEFQAGSIWTTRPGNTFKFDHRTTAEEGSFKIFQNGEVHILDEASGTTVKFYFDRDDAGIISLVYLSGPGKGKIYPLK